jgi:nucleoid-associated protein YgaU
MTHEYIVIAGDTLPALTNNIYGDSKYYLKVATYNKLDNFRQLVPGTKLLFPPLI